MSGQCTSLHCYLDPLASGEARHVVTDGADPTDLDPLASGEARPITGMSATKI